MFQQILKTQKVALFGVILAMLLTAGCGVGSHATKPSTAAIITKEEVYTLEGTEFTGYWAYPENTTDAPGVLVVHEWWGHNDYARMRAKQLAELGYVAFALDMYGTGKVANHPANAKEFMMEVGNKGPKAEQRFEKALGLLQEHPATSKNQTAALGYCFGGSVVINMARVGKDLDAVVSFHGGLGGLADIQGQRLETRFLVLNGADDPMITEEHISAFKADMDGVSADYTFVNYPGATHAFTNPGADEKGKKFGIPLAYSLEADKASWQEMKRFLEETFD